MMVRSSIRGGASISSWTSRARAAACLIALAVLPACGDDLIEHRLEAETGSSGDGAEGASLVYSGGHPVDWLTDEAAALQREDEVLVLINAHRQSIGLSPLQMQRTMRRCARGHSRHMREDVHDFFAHENPEGDSPGMRLSRNGVTWNYAAENITSGLLTPAAAVETWLNSPGHRRNIENPTYTRTGVGYQPGAPGEPYPDYYTQVFAD